MPKRTNNKPNPKVVKGKQKKTVTYSYPENPIEFYISEEIAGYGKKKPSLFIMTTQNIQ